MDPRYNGTAGQWVAAGTVALDRPRSMVTAVYAGGLLFFAGGEYAENKGNASIAECADTVEVSSPVFLRR